MLSFDNQTVLMVLERSNIKSQRRYYYLKSYDHIFGKFSNPLNH